MMSMDIAMSILYIRELRYGRTIRYGRTTLVRRYGRTNHVTDVQRLYKSYNATSLVNKTSTILEGSYS